MTEPVVTMFDISPLMLELCSTHRTASMDIETRPDEGQDQSGALDPRRGHASLIAVKEPLTGYREVVRLRVRGVERTSDHYPQNLAKLIEKPDVVKIFHHALFDLKFLYVDYAIRSYSTVCTKVAEKILHPSMEEKGFYSLVGLTKRYLGIDMAKGYALSDWEAPELSSEQIRYAAEDVEHLDTIFAAQAKLLGRYPELNDAAYRAFSFLGARVSLEMGYGITDVFGY